MSSKEIEMEAVNPQNEHYRKIYDKDVNCNFHAESMRFGHEFAHDQVFGGTRFFPHDGR